MPTEQFPKFDCVVISQKVFVCDADAESLSYFLCQSTSHCPKLARSNSPEVNVHIPIQGNMRTEDLMLSGRSFMKMRNRIGPKTDPWGPLDSTGTGYEAWPSNTTC